MIAYLIEILEDGYTFRNEGERILARELLEWEEWDKEFDNFLNLAVEVCSKNEELLGRAQNSSLASLVEAVNH